MNEFEEFYCPHVHDWVFYKGSGFGQMVIRRTSERAKEFRERKMERHPDNEIDCSHIEMLNLGVRVSDLASYIATMEDKRQIKGGEKKG